MSVDSISPISAGMPSTVDYVQPDPIITQADVVKFEERLAQTGTVTITIENDGCSNLTDINQLRCELRTQLEELKLKDQQYNNPYITPSAREVIRQEITELQGGLNILNSQVDSILDDIANRGSRGQVPAGDYNFGSTGDTSFGSGSSGPTGSMWNGGEVTNPYAAIAEPELGGGRELREMIRETERRLDELQWATRGLDPPPQ
ncbi:MAG: hypothetical protein AAGC81_07455 [Pseudomonadota bacterium]